MFTNIVNIAICSCNTATVKRLNTMQGVEYMNQKVNSSLNNKIIRFNVLENFFAYEFYLGGYSNIAQNAILHKHYYFYRTRRNSYNIISAFGK